MYCVYMCIELWSSIHYRWCEALISSPDPIRCYASVFIHYATNIASYWSGNETSEWGFALPQYIVIVYGIVPPVYNILRYPSDHFWMMYKVCEGVYI